MNNDIRAIVWDQLRDLGADSFESTLRDCRLVFPDSCWTMAREAGFSFLQVLELLHKNAYVVIDGLVASAALQVITFSSLFRPGAGPHAEGRGLDITHVRSAEGVDTMFNVGQAATEPELARDIRVWLFDHLATNQVLGPWFMCSGGAGCAPNRRETELEISHLTHMHVTVNP